VRPSLQQVPGPQQPSLRRAFELRVWARAYQFAEGKLMLWQAIEPLKLDAEASGLIEEIGKAEVERIIAAGFGWRHS
jgi:hypothetical protein